MYRFLFLWLSRQSYIQNLLERPCFSKLVGRFVAGKTLEEALPVIRALESKGFKITVDYLGEEVTDLDQAENVIREYDRLCSCFANVSIKLSQLGLKTDANYTYDAIRYLLKKWSVEPATFFRIDMEGSDYTEITLDIYRRLRAEFTNVGIVLQAYLYRTTSDIIPGEGIRLCKGAYLENRTKAYQKKADVDENYLRCMRMILGKGYQGIATHDPVMIEETKRYALLQGIGREEFEFQMLYGMRVDLQEALLGEGYKVRIYVPYGDAWYGYFMRRLAERPANLWFLLKVWIRF